MQKMTETQKMTRALARLYRELGDGREFPDACATACVICGVDSDDLRDAYDDAEAAFADRHPC